jgi:hypothetical protein
MKCRNRGESGLPDEKLASLEHDRFVGERPSKIADLIPVEFAPTKGQFVGSVQHRAKIPIRTIDDTQ